jgi:bifunctional non-homologous end joining protein LigD
MTKWQEMLSSDEQEQLEKSKHPAWVEPMQATLTDERFSCNEWIYEPKLDGERLLAFRHNDDVRLMTRNRRSASSTYPEILDALLAQAMTDFVVDGEMVAFKKGISSFSRLQQRMQVDDAGQAEKHRVAVQYYLFDLPFLDGYSLVRLPLRTRKKLLRQIFSFKDQIRFTAHRNRTGEAFFAEACRRGWEGVIAKRAESSYKHSRSRAWLKFKCGRGQELVIGGFTSPQGERVGFGALLVGYFDNEKFLYAGKVGTGYDKQFLLDFSNQLEAIKTTDSPFSNPPTDPKARWVELKHVAEIGFTEWTDGGKLRHPRFLGLRRDKDPREVIRETPDG